MERFYIFKDGMQQGSTATKESAVDLIRQYQKQETHPFLRAEFSIIKGRKNLSPTRPRRKHQEERMKCNGKEVRTVGSQDK